MQCSMSSLGLTTGLDLAMLIAQVGLHPTVAHCVVDYIANTMGTDRIARIDGPNDGPNDYPG